MARRRQADKRPASVDAKFNSTLVSRLINVLMRGGKKATARRIVYDALDAFVADFVVGEEERGQAPAEDLLAQVIHREVVAALGVEEDGDGDEALEGVEQLLARQRVDRVAALRAVQGDVGEMIAGLDVFLLASPLPVGGMNSAR